MRTTHLATLLALLAAPTALALPAYDLNWGTLTADAFAGCTPPNCDVRVITVDPGHAHTLTNAVWAVNVNGFPPAFELKLFVASGGALSPIAGCPDFFTPGLYAGQQACSLPAQTGFTTVVGQFIALRPHAQGVTFVHVLSAV
jgi:hypothetical protein